MLLKSDLNSLLDTKTRNLYNHHFLDNSIVVEHVTGIVALELFVTKLRTFFFYNNLL